MKKILTLAAISSLALIAACNNSGRVQSEAADTKVQACEKGSQCCKVTGNKADCKAACTDSKCSGEAKCSDMAK